MRICVSIPLMLLLGLSVSGCAPSRANIKATSPNTEVVESEGTAPIVNSDTNAAKGASLNDAMKNALGLVIGVYVSQEALVSKAVLIEDNITSQTEGYIEKYDVLKEWREGDFYRTRIRALVRKEDLSASLKALELEPKRLGNPVVKFAIEETVDGQTARSATAANELKSSFLAKGFLVSDTETFDLLVSGRAESTFNTDKGLGGFVSYRSVLSLNVLKSGSQDVITTVSETAGGVDVTRDAAAKKAIQNSAQKPSRDLPNVVLEFLKNRSTVQLAVSNVGNINALNDFTRRLRSLIEVRDCWVRSFSGGTALLDMDLKKGTASDIARRLEQTQGIKIKNVGAYNLEAELPNPAK